MVKFDASKFRTLPDPTPRKRFRYEVEDIIAHIRSLSTRPRVGWIKGHQDVLGVAPDLDTVGCMTVMCSAPSYEEREPYGGIDVAIYDDMTLREVIASWESNDDKASCLAAYPGSIEAGCRQLGWIVEPDDEELWDSYI